MTLTKNEKIKQKILETKQRRLTQRCYCFEFKINTGKLTKREFEQLKFTFVQCRWLYNYLLNLDDINKFDTKTRVIHSLDKDGNKISRTLTLPAKMIQSVYQILKQNIISLSRSKKKGNRVGRLKFKSEYNTIDLNQYGVTHRVYSIDKIKIVGFKKHFKVFGLKQLTRDYEFANAKLIQKPTGFYIRLTCFENLTQDRINKPIQEVGLDFGIKTHITTSDGEKFNITIEESERLKGLQRKLARQVKGSNNRKRTLQKIKVEYEKLANKKKDLVNKLIHYLCTKYSTIYMQDELIKLWHKGLFGKQVQHSALGLIKAKLKKQNNVKVVSSSFPSTKLCYKCGTIHSKITLADREFICPTCGFKEDRDIKAAKTILFVGQSNNTYIPTEHRNTDTERMSDLNNVSYLSNSR